MQAATIKELIGHEFSRNIGLISETTQEQLALTRVAVAGEVRRPAIYEIKGAATLPELRAPLRSLRCLAPTRRRSRWRSNLLPPNPA